MPQEIVVTHQSASATAPSEIVNTVLDAAATSTTETIMKKQATHQTPRNVIAIWSKNLRNRLDRLFARENSQYEISLSSRIKVCFFKQHSAKIRLFFVLVMFQGAALSGTTQGMGYFNDLNILLIRHFFERELQIVPDPKASTLKNLLASRFETKYLPKGMERIFSRIFFHFLTT